MSAGHRQKATTMGLDLLNMPILSSCSVPNKQLPDKVTSGDHFCVLSAFYTYCLNKLESYMSYGRSS